MPFQRKDKNDSSIQGLNFRKNELTRIIADVNTPPAIRYKCTLLLHRLCSTGEERHFYTAMVLGEVIKRSPKTGSEDAPGEEPSEFSEAVDKMLGYMK